MDAPDQFFNEALLALVSDEVGPERGKSLCCRLCSQTLRGRIEPLQQLVRFRGGGIGQPLGDRGVVMVMRSRRARREPRHHRPDKAAAPFTIDA